LWSFTRDIQPTLVSQFVTCQSSEKRVKETSRSWLPVALLGLVLFTAGLALAQSDPFVGTWELKVAKSKFGPGAERRSETRIVESSPTGISVDRTNADGSNQQYNYTTNFDAVDTDRIGI
jgi:hypothetical protein